MEIHVHIHVQYMYNINVHTMYIVHDVHTCICICTLYIIIVSPYKEEKRFVEKVLHRKKPAMPYMEEQRHRHGNHNETEEDHEASEDSKLSDGGNLRS